MMIYYKQAKGEIRDFISSLVDPELYTMEALLSVYWDRCEIEQSFDELKKSPLNGK